MCQSISIESGSLTERSCQEKLLRPLPNALIALRKSYLAKACATEAWPRRFQKGQALQKLHAPNRSLYAGLWAKHRQAACRLMPPFSASLLPTSLGTWPWPFSDELVMLGQSEALQHRITPSKQHRCSRRTFVAKFRILRQTDSNWCR